MLTLTCILLSSCNNELEEKQIAIPDEEQTIVAQSGGILSFDNEAAFWEAVEKVRNNEISVALLTRSTSEDDFLSLYREFDQAMEEADNFYQRAGGYEEFKQKFPNLYYPQYNDDYSAYLPVSDEAIAKLVNPQGKVIINGDERDMRDVFSYEKLQELGLAIPDETGTVSLRALPINNVIDPTIPYYRALTEVKKDITSKRKMWVTVRGIERNAPNNLPFTKIKEARIDVCFRKKGALGWYNGKLYGYPMIVDLNKTKYTLDRKYEYSPMKFTVMMEFTARLNDFPSHSPLDLYVRFESDQKDHDFTAVYPANLKQILQLNNGDGFWESLSGLLKKAVVTYGFKYGSQYITDYWNNL